MKIAEAKIYKPRNAQGTASYKIFDQHYYEFKQVYNQKYIWKYGFFRPIIDETVRRFLKCGILKYGFARIKCTNCNKEYLLPYLPLKGTKAGYVRPA